jgi:hypothetical protein
MKFYAIASLLISSAMAWNIPLGNITPKNTMIKFVPYCHAVAKVHMTCKQLYDKIENRINFWKGGVIAHGSAREKNDYDPAGGSWKLDS